MNQSPNLTARPEVITPAAPLIFEGVNDYGFAFRFEIRTARINGKRWAAAPDVMKAAGVRTRTASGKRKGTTNFLIAVPGDAKRLIQRHECPALFNLDGVSLTATIEPPLTGESEYSHQALAEVLTFRDSFNSLFFVSIGVLMDIRVVLEHPFIVLGLLLAVIVGKLVTGSGAMVAAGAPPRSSVLVGVALAQVGEFSFILAQRGQDAGLFTGDQYQLFLAVSVLTMVVTPFLMQWSPDLGRRIEAMQRVRGWMPTRTAAHVEQMEGSQIRIKDHVIIVGYGLNGRNLARVLSETEIPHVALDLDGETVRREARHGVPIY